MTFDGFDAGKPCIGDLPERLSGIHIGMMDFHSRYGNRLQSFEKGAGGVGLGGRIDDDAVYTSVCPLDLVHQITLVIGLIVFNL